MKCVAGCGKGHGRHTYPVISSSFITFYIIKHDGGWTFSLVFLFFVVCTSGVGSFVFFGGMENKFGLLHIFRMPDLVCRSIASFCFFYIDI